MSNEIQISRPQFQSSSEFPEAVKKTSLREAERQIERARRQGRAPAEFFRLVVEYHGLVDKEATARDAEVARKRLKKEVRCN